MVSFDVILSKYIPPLLKSKWLGALGGRGSERGDVGVWTLTATAVGSNKSLDAGDVGSKRSLAAGDVTSMRSLDAGDVTSMRSLDDADVGSNRSLDA